MTQISTNEFKQGLKIILDKSPCEIIEHEFHKPGKGQAVMRIKYRDLLSNRVLEKTFKTGESVEKAEISSKEMQFLYQQDNKVILMDTKSRCDFENLFPATHLQKSHSYLKKLKLIFSIGEKSYFG